MNILLFIHFVIAIFLIVSILLQKTSVDGVSTLSGNNMGLVSVKSVNTFLTRTTIILAALFFLNSILLANYAVSIGEQNTKKQNYERAVHNKNTSEESSNSEKNIDDENASSQIQKKIQKKQDNISNNIHFDNNKENSDK